MIFQMNQFLGILLIPVVIFIAYGPPSFTAGFIYLGVLLISLSFVVRVIKGVSSALKQKETTMFYIFLYFCTLELLPLIVLIKLLVGRFV